MNGRPSLRLWYVVRHSPWSGLDACTTIYEDNVMYITSMKING